MTDRAEIERLLNQTGRTLEGVPERYGQAERENAFKRHRTGDYVADRILHQSDVIELLVGALRDALEKPMQKPMQKTLKLEDVQLGDNVFIEFCNEEDVERVLIVPSFAPNVMGYARDGWSSRFAVDRLSYGKFWRMWKNRPTDEEREAAAWDT